MYIYYSCIQTYAVLILQKLKEIKVLERIQSEINQRSGMYIVLINYLQTIASLTMTII